MTKKLPASGLSFRRILFIALTVASVPLLAHGRETLRTDTNNSRLTVPNQRTDDLDSTNQRLAPRERTQTVPDGPLSADWILKNIRPGFKGLYYNDCPKSLENPKRPLTIDRCLIGTWELDNRSYEKWMNNVNWRPPHSESVITAKGSWRITFRRDGTFTVNIQNFVTAREKQWLSPMNELMGNDKEKNESTVDATATGRCATGSEGKLCLHGHFSGKVVYRWYRNGQLWEKEKTRQMSDPNFNDITASQSIDANSVKRLLPQVNWPYIRPPNRYNCSKNRLILLSGDRHVSDGRELRRELTFNRVSSEFDNKRQPASR